MNTSSRPVALAQPPAQYCGSGGVPVTCPQDRGSGLRSRSLADVASPRPLRCGGILLHENMKVQQRQTNCLMVLHGPTMFSSSLCLPRTRLKRALRKDRDSPAEEWTSEHAFFIDIWETMVNLIYEEFIMKIIKILHMWDIRGPTKSESLHNWKLRSWRRTNS